MTEEKNTEVWDGIMQDGKVPLDTEETVYSGQKTIRYEGFVASCPVDDTMDAYDITITYVPSGQVVEVTSVKELLQELEGVETLQEDLTEALYRAFQLALYPDELNVEVEGSHAGLPVVTERDTEHGR